MDVKMHINGFDIGHTEGHDCDASQHYYTVVAEQQQEGNTDTVRIRLSTDVFVLHLGYKAIERAIDEFPEHQSEYLVDATPVRIRQEDIRD